MKAKYDKRLRRLQKLRKRQWKDKGSAHKPKKPECLERDPFNCDSKDTQHFKQDVEIKLYYCRQSLVNNMDKISLVMLLFHARAKTWYYNIHVDIN